MFKPIPRLPLSWKRIVTIARNRHEYFFLHLKKIKIWRKQYGVSGMMKILFRKTVFSSWNCIIFTDNLEFERSHCIWPKGYLFAPPVLVSDLSATQLGQLKSNGFQGIIDQLRISDELYLITFGAEVVSVGAVLHDSPQRSVLGLSSDAVLIGHCETSPLHRNKGLYARALNETIRTLRDRGKLSIYMETRPENIVSQKGIINAGLKRDRVVKAQIWFRTLVVRNDGFAWINRR